MQESVLSIDESELARVAMFPLPNVVLLPGTLMPLHIFEPRYRDMIQDVLSGSGLLALARLKPGYEADYDNRPPVHPILGVGRVIASDRLDDGRYNILVRGLIRARLAEELGAPCAYRLVRASPLLDMPSQGPLVLEAAHEKLVAICDQLAGILEQGGKELRALARSASSPGGCADLVSSALITDPDDRQRLLEMRDPLGRLERVIQYVGHIYMELSPEPDPETMN